MENVEGMVNEVKDTGIKVGDLVLESLESIGQPGSGYKCEYRLLSCSDFGIPQHRERVIIVGIREDILLERDEVRELFERIEERGPPEEYNIQQGLSGLPKLRRGEGGTVVVGSTRGKRSNFVSKNALDEGTDIIFNHRAREHPMEKDRTLFDEALEPGETGWEVKYKKDGEFGHLIEYDVGTEENPRFKDKYRMLRWDQPSPTIVAHLAKDANSFVLPDYHEYGENTRGKPDNEKNRGITPREAARLQTFPDDYIILGSFTSWFRQIGNAIPPLLGEYIAHTLQEYIEDGKATGVSSSMPQPEQATNDD
jgi:DNA (cytosine-5)-methyltransferase 1